MSSTYYAKTSDPCTIVEVHAAGPVEDYPEAVIETDVWEVTEAGWTRETNKALAEAGWQVTGEWQQDPHTGAVIAPVTPTKIPASGA